MTGILLLVMLKNSFELSKVMSYKALINIGSIFVNQTSTISNASLLIENERIKEISSDPENTFGLEKDEIIDSNQHLIVPGFIDGHTHPIFSGSRAFELDYKLQGLSYSEIAERGGGINYSTSLTRKASKDELKRNLLRFCKNILAHGTTSAEIKTGYHLNIEGELLALEIIKEAQEETPITLVPTFLGAHLVPKEFKGKEDDYVQKLCEILPEVKKQGIATFTDVFCDQGAFTVDQTMELLQTSIQNNLPVRLHGEEIIRTGIASESAKRFGSWISSVDHLLKATEEDFKVLASKGITATFMPVGPIVLFDHQWPDYQMLKKSKVSIGLGSDFNPNSWFYSMQLVQSFATYFMHMPPVEALASATKNNAESLSLSDRGIIDVGKKADIVELSIDTISEIPYQIGSNNVKRVFKNGKLVLEN